MQFQINIWGLIRKVGPFMLIGANLAPPHAREWLFILEYSENIFWIYF
jgi:hypothetical protein